MGIGVEGFEAIEGFDRPLLLRSSPRFNRRFHNLIVEFLNYC